MRRVTVHLKNVEKVNVNGKVKLFNTHSFNVSNEKQERDLLSRFNKDNITKKYYSNL